MPERPAATKFEIRNGKPILLRLPKVDFLDDKAGKPVAIHKFVGRRPLLAFGNPAFVYPDGGSQMLQWASAGVGRGPAVLARLRRAECKWTATCY